MFGKKGKASRQLQRRLPPDVELFGAIGLEGLEAPFLILGFVPNPDQELSKLEPGGLEAARRQQHRAPKTARPESFSFYCRFEFAHGRWLARRERRIKPQN